MQSLVHNLLDVFEATRDLYSTLKNKEKRDLERNLRSNGYPASRSVKYVEDEEFGSDEAIVMDKAAVTRQFEIGYQTLGSDFAVGDGMRLQCGKGLRSAELNLLSISYLGNFTSISNHHASKCTRYDVSVRADIIRITCTSTIEDQQGVSSRWKQLLSTVRTMFVRNGCNVNANVVATISPCRPAKAATGRTSTRPLGQLTIQ